MRMGQKEDPDFTFRVMVVQAVWPGSSIQEMEDQVVNKIERKLQETPHLDFVRSYTRAGSAIITVQIKGDTNADAGGGRLLPGAQEGRRYRRRLAARPARPLFQRRVRRHLHHAAFDQRRRLQLSRAEEIRHPGARHAADDARRREGRHHRRPAREALYRRLVQGACRTRPDADRSAERDQGPEQCRSGGLGRHRHALGAHLGRRRRRPRRPTSANFACAPAVR